MSVKNDGGNISVEELSKINLKIMEGIERNNELILELAKMLDYLLLKGVKVECRSEPSGVISFMTVKGELGRAQGIESLRGFIGEAEKITVCDPYVFSSSKDEMEKQLEDILYLIPRGCKRLEVYTNPDRVYRPLINEVVRSLTSTRVLVFFTRSIHDRVWLIGNKSNRHGCITGTSLNGIGKRISFILRLPKKDVSDFDSELDRISDLEKYL